MPVLPREMVPGLLATGASSRLPDPVAPRFRAGDGVIARNLNPVGHTRLPRYIKGKRGSIRLDHGVFAFPDTTAHGLGHKPQHVYSVRFAAQELWGETASVHDSVYIDLFDDYLDLDPAAAAPAQEPARARGPSSRRSVRPQRAARSSKPRKSRRPGVRLQQAAEKSQADAPARASRKAVAATKKKSKKKKSALAKARKPAGKSRRGPVKASGGKKSARKTRLARP
ncbi:MAG: SH3-like domain-containing protein [Panacagrimonas sp.]